MARKLGSWKEMKKGGIYNMVYAGDNEAYAEYNGKQTVLVLELDPVKVNRLYDDHGSPWRDMITNGPITFQSPDIAFKDYEFNEPESEGEWYIKAMKFSSLAEAIGSGAVKLDQVQGQSFRAKQFEAILDWNMVSHCFSVEGTEEKPYLRSVFVQWKSWEEAQADFARYGAVIEDL